MLVLGVGVAPISLGVWLRQIRQLMEFSGLALVLYLLYHNCHHKA